MRILVTGGGGFIGSHLAARLVALGHEVRILDNFSTGQRSNVPALGEDVEIVEGDIRSYERAHTAVRGCEIVFHQAALPSVPRSIADPLTSNAATVTGTLNLLLAARDDGVRRVVLGSSSSVYGAADDGPRHEALAPLPISPYAVAKLACEGYARSFHEIYGLQTISLRYFNVFGPRQSRHSQYAAVVPRFISGLLSGRPPTIFGDGEQSRDFTYVDNVIDANLLAAETATATGQIYNVAGGEGISVNRLFAELRDLVGRDVEPVYVDARPGEIRHSHADLSLARRELGYEPRVGLRDGLRFTLSHYREDADLELPDSSEYSASH